MKFEIWEDDYDHDKATGKYVHTGRRIAQRSGPEVNASFHDMAVGESREIGPDKVTGLSVTRVE